MTKFRNSTRLPARPTYARRSAGFAWAGAAAAKAAEIQNWVRAQGASRKQFLPLTPNALPFTDQGFDIRISDIIL